MKKLYILVICLFVMMLSGCIHIFHGDRRPAPPHSHHVDKRPAPPPPNRHDVDRYPAPPAPSYNIQVRPAAPAPRR